MSYSVSLSNKIDEIEFKFTISLKETNIKWSSNASLTLLDTSIGWRDTQMATDEIQTLDSLTIEFKIDDITNVGRKIG